jgi:hypothetical protein
MGAIQGGTIQGGTIPGGAIPRFYRTYTQEMSTTGLKTDAPVPTKSDFVSNTPSLKCKSPNYSTDMGGGVFHHRDISGSSITLTTDLNALTRLTL